VDAIVEDTFEPTLKAPAHARQLLSELSLEDPCRQNLELIISELVSNAVLHAAPARDGALRLRVRCGPGSVDGEVCDEGAGFDWAPSEPDLTEPGGLGLMLVDHLTTRWGVRRNGATCVWFECPL
jgi:two-component sensor histidine kinase